MIFNACVVIGTFALFAFIGAAADHMKKKKKHHVVRRTHCEFVDGYYRVRTSTKEY